MMADVQTRVKSADSQDCGNYNTIYILTFRCTAKKEFFTWPLAGTFTVYGDIQGNVVLP